MSRSGWLWLVALGGLFVLLHWEFIRRAFLIATSSEDAGNWGHILAVPFISAYFIFQKRDELARLPRSICWWGLPILFAGMFSYVWWIWPGRNDMFRGYSMIVSLFGLVLLVLGPKMMRVLWFPIVYLVFAVKVSDGIWERVAWQLQQIAAKGSEIVLQFLAVVMDFDIARQGNQLTITFTEMTMQAGQMVPQTVVRDLNVAEACSGLRMLMAFVALGVAMAFLWDRAWWQRLTMVLMTIPVALLVNVGRVTAIAILYMYDEGKAQGEFHIFVGMLMLIPAAGLFWLLGWVLDKILITPSEPPGPPPTAPEPSAEAGPPAGPPVAAKPLALSALIGVGLVALTGGVYAAMLSLPQSVLDALPLLGEGVVGAAIRVVLLALLITALLPVLKRVLMRVDLAPVRKHRRVMVMVIAVLAASVVSQTAVLEYQGAVLLKKPVPLRQQLFMLPRDDVGPWKVVFTDPPMPKDIEQELGTDKYISWWYADTSVVDPDDLDIRRGLLGPPGAVARVHIAYYTGTIDAVPHVPDRCFVGAGLQPISRTVAPLSLDETGYVRDPEHGGYLHPTQSHGVARVPEIAFGARMFKYGNPDVPGTEQNVFYFFSANGKFLAAPWEVRKEGFNLTDEYSYYCKVEVQVPGVPDSDEAARRVEALLSHLLPEIMACLPDWVEVTQGHWPPPAEAARQR